MKVEKNKNPSHAHVLTRVNRIGGQVDGIKRMIQERRYSTDILIQLKAIRSAVRTLEAEVMGTHLEYCTNNGLLKSNAEERENTIEELKEIIKTFS